ncbi:hypothetical protein [Campylobacter sp.]|uniref:hypothetical protein n=1 Tax=Campylobacter sp. TaxID=205 RepID=UPI0025B82C4D|nr:hypothetical protein [Campylobacter sp.]
MSEYKNLLQTGQNTDLGASIQNLIDDNLKYIKTAFLCKIVGIENNKISIKPLLKQNYEEEVLILNNVMVGFSYSQNWQTQFKLKINDIGLAIVIQNDISSYKETGKEGLNNTRRFKDENDSIYIPLSLYTSLNNADVNFLIQNDKKTCKMEFNNDEIGIFKGKLLTLESENTTLKSKLKELAGLLEAMAGGDTAPDGHGHSSTTAPGSIGSFSKWGGSLDSLFKD